MLMKKLGQRWMKNVAKAEGIHACIQVMSTKKTRMNE
jgi:hypothetical protein